MKALRKKSADYGLYCFRLSKEQREELTVLLDKAKARLNRDRKESEYVITKNQILFEAIKLGLPLVKKEP
jgi:hypothetical protein